MVAYCNFQSIEKGRGGLILSLHVKAQVERHLPGGPSQALCRPSIFWPTSLSLYVNWAWIKKKVMQNRDFKAYKMDGGNWA